MRYWKTLCWSQNDIDCREGPRVRAGGPFQPKIPEWEVAKDVSSSPAAGGQGGLVQQWLLTLGNELKASQWITHPITLSWWMVRHKGLVRPSPALSLARISFCISLLSDPPVVLLYLGRLHGHRGWPTARGHKWIWPLGPANPSDPWGDPNCVPQNPMMVMGWEQGKANPFQTQGLLRQSKDPSCCCGLVP